MCIGASIYGYRSNFNCKEPNKIPKKKKIKLKLIDILRPGFRTLSAYDDDLFVSICQWLMKKGYPGRVAISDKTENIDAFLNNVLFSICPFHAENLRINKTGFQLYNWRNQFDIFSETEITKLNFYRNRASIPIESFSTFNTVKKILFTNNDFYNKEIIKLNFSPNSSWPDAIWILNKDILVDKDDFTYRIYYGCEDDYQDSLGGKAHSSWTVSIESDPGENYIDFCLRIYKNYEKILSGDKSALISKYDGDDFYLGGKFKLSN
jgi:hypothetical protein